MNADTIKSKITSRQLMFTVVCIILGSVLVSTFVIPITKQDSWFAIILGALGGIGFALIYVTLSMRFRSKTIIEINEIVYGKVIGKAISAVYLFYFLVLTCLNVREVANFVGGYIMPETPLYAIMIILVFISAYAVLKGIVVITHLSFLLLVVYLISLIFNFLLLSPYMNFNNFSPSFTLPFMKYAQSIHLQAAAPFGEICICTMIFPSVEEGVNIKKQFLIGILVGAVIMLAVVVQDWAILGNTAVMVTFSTLEVLRLVNIGDMLSRIEIIYFILYLVMLFFKISVFYYGFALSIKQTLNLKDYKPFVFVLGAIILCFSISIYNNFAQLLDFGMNTGLVYITATVALLPAITLIIAKVKRLKLNGGNL